MIQIAEGKVIYHYDAEELWIEGCGKNGIRIRATKEGNMPKINWALRNTDTKDLIISNTPEGIQCENGKTVLRISSCGKITVQNRDKKVLLEEYWRNRRDIHDKKCSALEVEAREFKPVAGGNYHLTMRFESLDREEKIYGMGQYQQPFLNLKGMDLELAQRNSQASVPFFISSLGYGFLWNNPAVGRAVLGQNIMSFEAYSTEILDYWITAGDTPAELEESYAEVSGTVPMMPEYGLGFWQCKLRYQTQDELLNVAREYKKRNLPIDVIVIDFFHWTRQGEWEFDTRYWPDPEGMVKELNKMGIELMVSVWPTVERDSKYYNEMLEKGYLIRTERGFRAGLYFEGATVHYDATNPKAREYVWSKVRKNYYDKGIRLFWLDEAEPEYTVYDFDNYRYNMGTDLEIGNIYPLEYAHTFYEGMCEQGQINAVNLLRCAWAGSQNYGALVWSGDIASSFESMRNQLSAGLNIGIAGIPWWTTDIGGFHGGDPSDPAFRELFVRWFEWAAFCPVMRLHGDREPRQEPLDATETYCCSGADNEVWSYGEEVYEICKKYLDIRESLRDYTRHLMLQAHIKGSPVIRTLFYEFPQDTQCWEIEDEYMYGDKFLVAPVLEAGKRERMVYFPKGADWKEMNSRKLFCGGTFSKVQARLSEIPVFKKQ